MGITSINLERSATVLNAKEQGGKIVLYVRQDLDLLPTEATRCFRCVPTGVLDPILDLDTAIFIDTVMLNSNTLVFHIYEV